MKQLIFFAALTSAALSQDSSVTPRPWLGPLADHVLGVPPKDTPEVSAAKVALSNAHSEILALIPILPPEERYIRGPRYHQPNSIAQPVILNTEAPTVQNLIIPAQQVPRSFLGEVPEVQAAREAHFRAYGEIAARLPKLAETTAEHHRVPAPIPGLAYVIPDAPEVARAKAEHAAAVAASLG